MSPLLRRSIRRPDGTVGKQTVANLSMLPAAAVDAIEAVLVNIGTDPFEGQQLWTSRSLEGAPPPLPDIRRYAADLGKLI